MPLSRAGLQPLQAGLAGRAQQVVAGSLKLVAGVIHLADAARSLDETGSDQFTGQRAPIFDGMGQFGRVKDAAAKLAADALTDRMGQMGGCQGRFQQHRAHLLLQRCACFRRFAFRCGFADWRGWVDYPGWML